MHRNHRVEGLISIMYTVKGQEGQIEMQTKFSHRNNSLCGKTKTAFSSKHLQKLLSRTLAGCRNVETHGCDESVTVSKRNCCLSLLVEATI